MNIEKIITYRKYGKWKDFQLVFEWEDIICKELGATFYYEKKLFNNRFVNKTIFKNVGLPNSCAFLFDMYPRLDNSRFNRSNIIPCIIDYYLKDGYLSQFEEAYSNHPYVFISSKQVFSRLKKLGCKLPIYHLPLSISDKHIKMNFISLKQKYYDIICVGRPNKVLNSFLSQLSKENIGIKYVYCKKEKDKNLYYSSTGECLGEMKKREDYLGLIRNSKIGLYSTPGYDGDELRTGNSIYSQVTPRFFEYIACGCHIISRFPQNEDTDYFELDRLSYSVDSYVDFKDLVLKLIDRPINTQEYLKYLERHKTSERAKMIKNILKD